MASAGNHPDASGRVNTPPVDFAYKPALDGWRAISILLVIISHGGLGHIVPGGLGVTIFFFISGYLITSLLISEFNRDGNISLKNFYLRRFWRLSPPLIIYISLSTLLILFLADHFSFIEPLSAILYFANYYSIYWHYESLPFGPSPLKIVWSLAIEEHYYIFFAPLVAVFAHTQRRLFTLLLFLIFIPLIIRLETIFNGSSEQLNVAYTYMATEARIDSIAWGALLAWLCNYFSSARLKSIFDNKIAIGFSLALMLLSLLFRDDRFRETIRYTLQGIALVPLFYVTLNGESLRRFDAFITSSLAILVGKLSYSIYLYHWLALIIASWVAGNEKISLPWLVTYYLLTIVFSYSSYQLIEKPSLALRKKYGSRATA
jgi:peptidoglycan/LPS O-acetylase OafA/YrhL